MMSSSDLKIILITSCVCGFIAFLMIFIFICFVYRRYKRQRVRRPRTEEEGASGIDNHNMSVSESAPNNENLPPSQTTWLDNYDQLVIDHVFKMHQDLPPLEPSAPPLPP